MISKDRRKGEVRSKDGGKPKSQKVDNGVRGFDFIQGVRFMLFKENQGSASVAGIESSPGKG